MPKIKNERYLAFWKDGIIQTISQKEFDEMLQQIDYSNPNKQRQARSLAILAFYSGLRPVELIKFKPSDCELSKNFVKIKFCTNKKGRFSTAWFPLKIPHIKEFWEFVSKGLPNYPVFHLFESKRRKKVSWTVKRTGEKKTKIYSWPEANIQYFFQSRFGLPPYFFRHNCFSSLSELGATDRQIRQAKGASSWQSIEPYIHLSQEQGLKTARLQSKR